MPSTRYGIPLLAAAFACSPSAKGPDVAPQPAPKQLPAPAPKPGDAVIDGCLAEYPKTGHLGGGINAQRAWRVCMTQSGQQSGLCDTASMMGLATAVCIARGKGLPMAAQWRVRLEFAPAPVPRVLWRLALADESQHTLVDAHSGESVLVPKPGKGLQPELEVDPGKRPASAPAAVESAQ